jgi:predicted PurR-regulated permease PerM
MARLVVKPLTIRAYWSSGLLAALVVFFGIVLINAFFDEIFKPKMLGEGLDLAPVMVIFSLAIWTAV